MIVHTGRGDIFQGLPISFWQAPDIVEHIVLRHILPFSGVRQVDSRFMGPETLFHPPLRGLVLGEIAKMVDEVHIVCQQGFVGVLFFRRDSLAAL